MPYCLSRNNIYWYYIPSGMLLEHQGVRKGLSFKMFTGSISPGPQYNINILFFFIFYFFLSHVTLLICVQTSTKHSVLTSTTTSTTNTATTVQQQHHQHHHSSTTTTTTTTTTTRVGAESNRRKVPRRRVSHRLGPRWVDIIFLRVFSILIDTDRFFWCI